MAWQDLQTALIAESEGDITQAIAQAVMLPFTPSFAVIGSAHTRTTDEGISVPTTIGMTLATCTNLTKTDLASTR